MRKVDRILNVKQAVRESGAIKTPEKPLTEKQIQKKKQQDEQYWNTMISRGEVHDIFTALSKDLYSKYSSLFIQMATLTKIALAHGVTQEEIDSISKPIIESIYGKQPVPTPADGEPTLEIKENTDEEDTHSIPEDLL